MSIGAWAPGLVNGYIPASLLAPVAGFKPLADGWSAAGNGSATMRADAARQLSGLQRAFYRRFRVRLYVREAYRSRAGQDWYYNRYMKRLPGWTLAAFPGTSIHGWALSADLGVGEGNANPSGEYLAWLRANAESYGFRNDVASETWHWSYLVTPTITIAAFIGNPFADAEDNPTPTEDEMGIRLIRNKTKTAKNFGEIRAISVEDGWHRHLDPGYPGAWEGAYGIKVEDMEDNWFRYWVQMCDQTRDETNDALAKKVAPTIAAAVWSSVLDGWNGKQRADARLVGADKKADALQAEAVKAVATAVVQALPASSGGAAPAVDVQALAKALSDVLVPAIVKASGDDLSARLKA